MRFATKVWILPMLLVSTTHLRSQSCTPTGQQFLVKCDGYVSIDGKSNAVVTKSLGVAQIDITGAFTSNGSITVAGQLGTQVATGSVSIGSNCTGSVSLKTMWNGQAGPTLNFLLVVTPDQNTIEGLNVDSGNTFACTMVRLSPSGVAPVVPPTPTQITGIPTHPIVVPSPVPH